jgi:hypothetical protein
MARESRGFQGSAPLMEKKSFLTSSEGAIASYNWVDIQSGSGYSKFYGFVTRDNTTLYTKASSSMIYSEKKETVVSGYSKLAGKVFDRDFDILFNFPQIINGDCLIQFLEGIYNSSTACSFYWTVKLRKWDGTTETELNSARTEEVSQASGHGIVFHNRTLAINLNNEKFKQGESLRITIEGYQGDAPDSNEKRFILGTDPKGRDGEDYINTANNENILIFEVPFKIDI